MTSRAVRWALAGAGITLAVIPAAVLLRGHGPASPHTVAAAAAAQVQVVDASRPSWFGLRVLGARVRFTPERAAPSHPPAITAAAGILVDADTGRILWEVNDHTQLAPASTIKLLTALVVLENFDPDQLITVTPDALFQRWDESRMGLRPGNMLSVRELITGLLTVSANDAADVLAVDTVGLERFVGAMNAEAGALGLRDTHATSPVGLDDPSMHSSAYDLAVLASVDIDHFALFRSIVATQAAVLPATALHPAFYLDNVNLLLRMYPAAVGIKTGYTGNAGACEVGMAVRDGHRLIDVLLNGDLVYSSSKRLLDWGFTQEGLPSQLPPSPSPSPAATHR